MEFLLANRAPNLPPQALADIFDQLIWCMADNGAALLEVREDWLRSNDKPRVEIALAMNETYPFDEASEMELVFTQIAEKWPELSARCRELMVARNEPNPGQDAGPGERRGLDQVYLRETGTGTEETMPVSSDGETMKPRGVKLIWSRGVGVGPFVFGAPVSDYSGVLQLPLGELSAEHGGGLYEAPIYDGVTVYAEGGAVESVNCCSEFWIGSENVIGMTRQAVIGDILRKPDEVEVEDVLGDWQEILYYYPEGLMIWVCDGSVVTVQAGESFASD